MAHGQDYEGEENGWPFWSCSHFNGAKKAEQGRPQLSWGACYPKFRNAESSGTHASLLLPWRMGKTMEAKRMAGLSGAARTSMAQKKPRKAAHSSLGALATPNLGTQKARAHMLSNCCHGAWARLWRQREWLPALELAAFQWRKKSRARPLTALLGRLLPQI
jgi:hypothetical protein